LIGKTLSHFKIIAKLGEGGMGEVYRAEDTELGRDVAIKVLPEAVASDPERLARFERKARLLASLNHPRMAGIHQIWASSLQALASLRFGALFSECRGVPCGRPGGGKPLPYDIVGSPGRRQAPPLRHRGVARKEASPSPNEVRIGFGPTVGVNRRRYSRSSQASQPRPIQTKPHQGRPKPLDSFCDFAFVRIGTYLSGLGSLVYQMCTTRRLAFVYTCSSYRPAAQTGRDPWDPPDCVVQVHRPSDSVLRSVEEEEYPLQTNVYINNQLGAGK